MTVRVDRRREQEIYDLELARTTVPLAVDTPVGRLLAIGMAAIGSETLLLVWPTRTRRGCYLVADPPAKRDADPVVTFADKVVSQWFPDARVNLQLIWDSWYRLDRVTRDIGSRTPLLVIPADQPELVAGAYEVVEMGDLPSSSVRIVAHGPRGVCLVQPEPSEAREQLHALRGVMEGDPGEDPLSLDTALIAAGMLMHETRLASEARVFDATNPLAGEQDAHSVCTLQLPDPAPRLPRSMVCVGAGGIGGILGIFGIAPSAPIGTHITLVDGDHAMSHNLLLNRWAGIPKVQALKAEMERYAVGCTIDTVAEMVDEHTRLPEAETYYAVTDSMESRAMVREAIPAGANATLVCSGSSLTGAEAFLAGGGPACVTCRFPDARQPDDRIECARNPASFASNVMAAGLAMALGRRAGVDDFIHSEAGASRYLASTQRLDRFVGWLPQTCEHFA